MRKDGASRANSPRLEAPLASNHPHAPTPSSSSRRVPSRNRFDVRDAAPILSTSREGTTPGKERMRKRQTRTTWSLLLVCELPPRHDDTSDGPKKATVPKRRWGATPPRVAGMRRGITNRAIRVVSSARSAVSACRPTPPPPPAPVGDDDDPGTMPRRAPLAHSVLVRSRPAALFLHAKEARPRTMKRTSLVRSLCVGEREDGS